MADILGLWGHNFSNGNEYLVAVWHKTPIIRLSGQWSRGGPTLTDGTKAEMESFLDHLFLVNGTDLNYSWNGGAWSSTINLAGSPIAKLIKRYQTRLYLFNIKINGVSHPSRVWFSDLPENNSITWGLETGNDLTQTGSSATVTSAGSLFKSRNIKVGDPFTITSGANQGEYTVQTIDSETQITFTETLDYDATGSSFWVGSNWFDVETDDGDVGVAMERVSNELVLYKKNSAHRYNASGGTLTKIKSMPGTTSQRGTVTGTDGYAYSYHPTGIYRTLGTNGQLISNPIEDIVAGVSDTTEVVAWEEDRKFIVFHLGDVTTRDGDTITNCEVKFDHTANNWTTQSRDRTVKVATPWLEDNEQKTYIGDDSDGVFEVNTGNAFTSGSTVTPIVFEMELVDIFPGGSEAVVDFNRLRAYIDNGLDIQIYYKLIYMPGEDEDHWISDNTWRSMRGSQRGSRAEWYFPHDARASGVRLKIVESSKDESFLFEKLVLYYSNEGNT